jgi:hypothetical protein
MPESRGRHPKKPNPKAAKSIATSTPRKTEEIKTHTQPPARQRWRPLEIWKNVWAILGPIVSMTAFSFLMWPQVKIEPSANPNPTDPLGTEFVVTNSGNVPVYNVRFSCGLGSGSGHVSFKDTSVNPWKTLSPAAVLPAGAPVARSCAVSSEGSQFASMSIIATYEWPLIWKESSKSAFFKVIRSTNGIAYLVPDSPPARNN